MPNPNMQNSNMQNPNAWPAHPPAPDSLDIVIRPATAEDASAIARIYNEGILDRIATLETELRTEAERRQWLAGKSPRHPVFVAVAAVGIVGWASLNVFNPRRCYDSVADISVYVARDWRGHGIGRRLLDHLVIAARERGFHKLVLATFPFNAAGLALYRRVGFTPVGTYHEQGQLDGRWVDILVMEKLL